MIQRYIDHEMLQFYLGLKHQNMRYNARRMVGEWLISSHRYLDNLRHHWGSKINSPKTASFTFWKRRRVKLTLLLTVLDWIWVWLNIECPDGFAWFFLFKQQYSNSYILGLYEAICTTFAGFYPYNSAVLPNICLRVSCSVWPAKKWGEWTTCLTFDSPPRA